MSVRPSASLSSRPEMDAEDATGIAFDADEAAWVVDISSLLFCTNALPSEFLFSLPSSESRVQSTP